MWLGMHRIVSLCYDLFFPFQQEKKKKKHKFPIIHLPKSAKEN